MGQNKLKIISSDKYHSETTLDPKDKGTQELYFKIYEEYVLTHSSEKALAEKYGYSISHISRIIKWVVMQLGDPDPSVQLRSMIDNLKARQQDIELELQQTQNTQDKVSLWQELRRIDKLIAQLQGLLSTPLIDLSDRRQVTIVMNNLERRTGTNTTAGREEEDDEREE